MPSPRVKLSHLGGGNRINPSTSGILASAVPPFLALYEVARSINRASGKGNCSSHLGEVRHSKNDSGGRELHIDDIG